MSAIALFMIFLFSACRHVQSPEDTDSDSDSDTATETVDVVVDTGTITAVDSRTDTSGAIDSQRYRAGDRNPHTDGQRYGFNLRQQYRFRVRQ